MSLSHWSHPSLNVGPREDERAVGWLELFYDLIFVAALIEVGSGLVEDVSWPGVGRFVVLFTLLWWAWTGMTFYMNRIDVDDLWHRLLVIAQMFAIGTLAILVDEAFGSGGAEFALAYGATRLTLVAMYVRAYRHVPEARGLARGFGLAFAVGAALWIISAFAAPPLRYALWAAAVIVDLSRVFSPAIRRLVADRLPPNREHLSERYALFTMIVLGESFIKTIGAIADEGISLDTQVLGALGLAITAALWWTYFDDVADSPIVRSAGSITPMTVWIYGHLPLTMGLTAVGVGVKKLATSDLNASVGKSELALLTGALVMVLLSVAALDAVTRNRHFGVTERNRLVPRLSAATALGVVGAVGAAWSALAVGAVIAAIVVAQIAAEVVVAQRADRMMRTRVASQVHPATLDDVCTHLRELGAMTPRTAGCAGCLEHDGVWVHLRLCTTCGHVGCCDDSEGRHATGHYHETGHPTMRSVEPDEHWAWCFVDEMAADLDPRTALAASGSDLP